MVHEWHAPMIARTALFALAVFAFGCSKPQTPVQLHASIGAKSAVVESSAIAVSTDKPATTANSIDPSEFAQVVSDGRSMFVVLSAAPEHERWAKGAPSLVSKGNPVVARREVDQTLLPKAMIRLTGRSMRLEGTAGEVCRGTLAEPMLLSRVEPHFGERSHWNGEEEDENGVKIPAFTDDRVAEIAWDMTTDGKLLVAELVGTTGDCQDALFARAAELPVLPTVAARRPSASLTMQAMDAFRKLPAYETIEKTYRSSSQATPSVSWTESPSADVSMYEFSTGKGTFLWVSAFGGEACSEFSGQMNVLWKVSGTNAKKFEFSVVYEGDADFSPRMLLQLPGDEVPSLLGRESILRKDTKVYDVQDLHVPFLDCPC